MYSTARRLSTICAILSAANIMATVMFFLYFPNSDLGFTMIFTIGTFLVTTSAISLLLTICLRSLCLDLELEFENDSQKLRELTKKVQELEYKCK